VAAGAAAAWQKWPQRPSGSRLLSDCVPWQPVSTTSGRGGADGSVKLSACDDLKTVSKLCLM